MEVKRQCHVITSETSAYCHANLARNNTISWQKVITAKDRYSIIVVSPQRRGNSHDKTNVWVILLIIFDS